MLDAEATSHWIDMYNMHQVFFNTPMHVGDILHITGKSVYVDMKKGFV